MELTGFGKINEIANKSRAKKVLSVENYKESIAEGINSIPSDKRQKPKLNIVGPAIEASKFYIEEKILRDMFAEIVIASVDSSKSGMVHESFVEIVKQLSTTDAKHISQISKADYNPIISLLEENEEFNIYSQANDLFLSNYIDNTNQNLIGASLVNLQRLGLIEISRIGNYAELSIYNELINCNFVKDWEKKILDIHKMRIQKGNIQLTSLGIIFCTICL